MGRGKDGGTSTVQRVFPSPLSMGSLPRHQGGIDRNREKGAKEQKEKRRGPHSGSERGKGSSVGGSSLQRKERPQRPLVWPPPNQLKGRQPRQHKEDPGSTKIAAIVPHSRKLARRLLFLLDGITAKVLGPSPGLQPASLSSSAPRKRHARPQPHLPEAPLLYTSAGMETDAEEIPVHFSSQLHPSLPFLALNPAMDKPIARHPCSHSGLSSANPHHPRQPHSRSDLNFHPRPKFLQTNLAGHASAMAPLRRLPAPP